MQHPVHRHAYTLVHHFRMMITHDQERVLSAWLHAAETSGIPELVSFAKGSGAHGARRWSNLHFAPLGEEVLMMGLGGLPGRNLGKTIGIHAE